MRHLFLCVALSCCGCADRKDAGPEVEPGIELTPEYDPSPDQSWWQLYRAAKGEPVRAAVLVRIAEGSRLLIKAGEDWRQATLDGFGERLIRAKRQHSKERRAVGKSGYVFDEYGSNSVSRIFVEMDIHPDAPWKHLFWLLMICMEEKIDKVQLRVGDRMIHLFLPWDAAIEWTTPPPLTEVNIKMRAGDEVAAKWGQATVRRPTSLRFLLGGGVWKELADVPSYLKSAERDAAMTKPNNTFVPLLWLTAKMPVARILELIELLLDSGFPRFDLRGTSLPKEDRQRQVLRYPE